MAKRATHRLAKERAIEAIYAEIPRIPACDGSCSEACGPIAMFKGEWQRVVRSAGRTPRLKPGSLICPLLSPTGKCTVYTVRPFICRLWGATKTLRCPHGCEPERWLTTAEAHEIFTRLSAIAGPEVDGPLGSLDTLWENFQLEDREARIALLTQIKEAADARVDT